MTLDFGQYLRNLRTEKKLTLKELGDKSGVSYTQIGKIERGIHTPSRQTVERIANALFVDKDHLMNLAGYSVANDVEIIKMNHSNTDKVKYSTQTYFKTIDPDTKYNTLIKFNSTCQLCGAKAPTIEINVTLINPNESISPKNLITLCENCDISRNKQLEAYGLSDDYLLNKYNN